MAPRELYSLRLRESSEQTEDAKKSIEFVVQSLKCFIWCSGNGRDSDSKCRCNLMPDGPYQRKQNQMVHEVASKMNRYQYSMEKENSCYDSVSRLCETVDFVENLQSFLTSPSAHLRAVILNGLW